MKQTSKDNANNEYMTECDKVVVNFDKVVKEYCKDINISTIGSNDALCISEDVNAITFIEFKNGYINTSARQKILKKIYDSLLVFSDVTHYNISFTRQYMNYILVYNEEKNLENDDPKTEYRESKSRDNIDSIILGYANERHIKYGFEFLSGYCFNEVNTYSKREFEELFVKNI